MRYPDSAEADVVSAIELGLTEISASIRNEDYFRRYLQGVIREYRNILLTFPAGVQQKTEITSSSPS
jgi:hypothetical protein